jgi:hypothetical protein
MSFQYFCFISHPVIKDPDDNPNQLMRSFLDELREALQTHLGFYTDKKVVYLAERDMSPGVHFNKRLGQALCRSVCWIVVYSPIYDEREYCQREYAAMEKLEEMRKQVLQRHLPPGDAEKFEERGMIIPILLKGKLPDRIKKEIHFSDFSRYGLASPKILTNEKYDAEIRRIAQYIWEYYKALEGLQGAICDACHSYTLPEIGPIEQPDLQLPPLPLVSETYEHSK